MSDLSSMNQMNLGQMNLGSSLSQASSYTDFNALAELRAKVTNGSAEKSAEATKEVAQQFESLFLQMMLKSMRDATYVDEDSGSDQTRFYQEMFDKQIALDLSNRENGGIGLAKIMEQQMSGGVQKRPQEYSPDHFQESFQKNMQENSLEHSFNNLRTNFNNNTPVAAVKQNALSTNFSLNKSVASDSEVKDSELLAFDSPEAFTQALWPHANKVADKLGVKAEVLIAQAALETGWGDKMIKDKHGNSANNLFGIKADSRWQGNQVTVSTLEFRDGIAAKEQASFRSYDSFAQSFDDYAEFLQNNPRYQDALANTGDSNVFLEKLQQAGYSTDPAYGVKIQSITQRDSFVKTVNALTGGGSIEGKQPEHASHQASSQISSQLGYQQLAAMTQTTNSSMRGSK